MECRRRWASSTCDHAHFVREVETALFRFVMSMYAARGAIRGLRACIFCSQCRMLSTETQEAGSSVLERHASSWSGGSAERSVSRERAGPGFLLRTTPDGPANRAESAKESSHVARYYIDTQAMVKTLEEGGIILSLSWYFTCTSLPPRLGYSRQQAECLVSFLSTTLTANLEPLVTSQVSRKDIVSCTCTRL